MIENSFHLKKYKMSLIESDIEAVQDIFDRDRPKRSCLLKKEQESRKSVDDHDSDEGEDSFDSEPADDSSDEDFSPNKTKKKRKKLKRKHSSKVDEPQSRSSRNVLKKNKIPSFDQVMEIQIKHAQRFIDYDIFGSESSSNEGNSRCQQSEEEFEARERTTPTLAPEPPKEKRKKIIIYPWNPIGITGGRPMPDSSKLD